MKLNQRHIRNPLNKPPCFIYFLSIIPRILQVHFQPLVPISVEKSGPASRKALPSRQSCVGCQRTSCDPRREHLLPEHAVGGSPRDPSGSEGRGGRGETGHAEGL